ncbi:hypothetical protein PG993_008075 [Apiospora rasikravindrae]|uniref:Uncharacterized protein n=1 Tax=Apiospora rasikravindrae TaxID=990691 RepID=A0ABR1T161_9PEZI
MVSEEPEAMVRLPRAARTALGTSWDSFLTGSRVFENRNFLVGLGNRISPRLIADEKTLEYFLHNTVEDPVRAILEQLKRVEAVASAYQLGDGIIFENPPHAISDLAEEVVARETRVAASDAKPPTISTPATAKPDLCLPRQQFPVGTTCYTLWLRAMNIYKEVVNRKLIPTSADPDARFQYHAKRLVASAITQTYHYMMESGLEYGQLTTGETIVFLKVDWAEPQTLYYHLADPGPEVLAHLLNANVCSAVGQCLFTLMALGAHGRRQQHGQDERQRAMDGLKTWAEDLETTLRKRSIAHRVAHRMSYANRDAADGMTGCLLGLVLGKLLHSTCPNVSLHRKGDAGNRGHHPVSHDEWIRLREQLEQSLDDGIIPLDDGGARSVLFKVTLLAYGYTFVSKCIVQAFVEDLGHEAAGYRRLRPL